MLDIEGPSYRRLGFQPDIQWRIPRSGKAGNLTYFFHRPVSIFHATACNNPFAAAYLIMKRAGNQFTKSGHPTTGASWGQIRLAGFPDGFEAMR